MVHTEAISLLKLIGSRNEFLLPFYKTFLVEYSGLRKEVRDHLANTVKLKHLEKLLLNGMREKRALSERVTALTTERNALRRRLPGGDMTEEEPLYGMCRDAGFQARCLFAVYCIIVAVLIMQLVARVILSLLDNENSLAFHRTARKAKIADGGGSRCAFHLRHSIVAQPSPPSAFTFSPTRRADNAAAVFVSRRSYGSSAASAGYALWKCGIVAAFIDRNVPHQRQTSLSSYAVASLWALESYSTS